MKSSLIQYILQIADTDMVLGQRLSELCGHGPILEQDMAMTNIALDLLGEANYLYQYVTDLLDDGTTADQLAFERGPNEYHNLLLAEQPNGNFADTITRQYFFDVFHLLQMKVLAHGPDETLRAIANRSQKEITYHLKFSKSWMLRLGDGTEESHLKTKNAVHRLYSYTSEMFMPSKADTQMIEIGITQDFASIKPSWTHEIKSLMAKINISLPQITKPESLGKEGHHTRLLEMLLDEMQYLQKTYPNLEW